MDDIDFVHERSRSILFTMAYPSKTSPEAIRAAAIDLLEREGEAALTLRRVAGVFGVVPNALYRYYATRDVLVAAVADQVARRLLAAINKALDRPWQDGPHRAEDRIRTLMEVYAAFADAHPALYATLMTNRPAAEAKLPQPLGYDLLWARVIEVLEPLTGQADAPAAAVTLWSLLHGMWALDRANLLGDQKPKNVGGFAINVVLKGLAT
jgi:AcrR family transcriptional regulator